MPLAVRLTASAVSGGTEPPDFKPGGMLARSVSSLVDPAGRLGKLQETGAVMIWTEEAVETARQLWREGKSASQIAKEIGAETRSMVIGKLHRLGIAGTGKGRGNRQGRAGMSKAQMRAQRERRVQAAKAAAPKVEPKPKPVITRPIESYKPIARKTFDELESSDCRFPVGNETPFMFCAAPAVEGKPYCSDCCRVAYSAPVVRPPRATLVPTFRQFERT